MRAGDAEVHGDFPSRIVQDGPRIMVMRPVIDIVVVLADVIDFVFGLDRAMFGQSDIHPNSVG